MTKSEFTIRNATQQDVEDWFGERPRFAVRAVVGELDGKVIAIGGVYREQRAMVGIAGLKPEMRSRKKDIVRMVKAGLNILQNYNTVVALPDKNEPTADAFIRHLGFERTSEGIYTWTRSQA